MMEYEMFRELVAEQFLNYMPDAFVDYQVRIKPVNKTNQILDGMSLIAPKGQKKEVVPTIYINFLYEEYQKGGSFRDIINSAAMELAEEYSKVQEIPDNLIGDLLSSAEDKIIMTLINTEQNKEMLKDIPHREFCDLSIVYRLFIGKNETKIHTGLITDQMAEEIGMTEPQLYEAAVVNTKNLLPPVVKPMNEVMREMFLADGMPEEIAGGLFGEMPVSMYILSNSHWINGAVSMLYETQLYDLAEDLGDDLYVLPSSIHEVIAVPISAGDPEKMAQTVAGINMDQVALEDRLSNQVYHYDKDLRKLTLATDTPNKRLDGITAEPALAYEAKQSR